MKKAIIFLNGNLTNLESAKQYIKKTDYIICADGGTKHALKLGFKPDVILGDLDSLSKTLQTKLKREAIEWITFKIEKDETDSELALQFAIEKGHKEILIFGLLGSRLDHVLTNIFALSRLLETKTNITFVEGKQEMRVIQNSIKIEGKIGDLISLLPLKEDVLGITTKGLQYPLKNDQLLFGYSRGISNVFTKHFVEISLTKGQLLIIHTKS